MILLIHKYAQVYRCIGGKGGKGGRVIKMQQCLCSLQFCCIVMKSTELFAQNPVFISITLMLIQFYEIACCTCKKKGIGRKLWGAKSCHFGVWF